MLSAVDHSTDQGTALAPFPHLQLFEMLCSVFIPKVSLFFKCKITCHFIQCTFFLSVSVSSHTFPHTPLLPSIFSKHAECRNHIHSKKNFKTLPCNGYKEPEDGDTGWETGQRPHTDTTHVWKILKGQKSKCAKPVRSWRADEISKAEFNLKKMSCNISYL